MDENFSHTLLEKTLKLYKSHRSIADTGTAAIKKIAKKENKLTNEIGEKNATIAKAVVAKMSVL